MWRGVDGGIGALRGPCLSSAMAALHFNALPWQPLSWGWLTLGVALRGVGCGWCMGGLACCRPDRRAS
eukprot:13447874-Alexandrium_andersonii.AAC.1